MYTDLASGDVIDTEITGDDVLPYEDGVFYWGYFSSIVVHPEYRQHGIATQMLLYWSDLVFRLATNRSIFFRGIVADAVSDVGVYLLSEIGFSFAKPSTHESKIMTLNLFSDDVDQSKFNIKVLSAYKEYKEGNGKCDVV
jgi:GNAT superfamily N-acetyltransferase